MSKQIETPLTSGTLLENRYRIRGLLGQGGMSRVYLADDLRLGMRIAVKENLQTTSEARVQFEREARLLASLSHPNLPRVIDHFANASTSSAPTGRQYLVMDYIDGEDLEAMIKRVGALPEATALNWIQQILDAVEYLHSQNPPIIHRDIKPSNIKITPQGKAILVDFGIAKVYDPRLATLTGARAVTPGYAPPEQYGMRTTERSDIYALGATLYTALTGRVPPEAPLRVSGEEPLISPNRIVSGKVSVATERVVMQAMELQTDRRWQSAGQMQAALEGRGEPPQRGELPTVTTRGRGFNPTIRANPNLIILIGGLATGLILVVALIVVFVVGQRISLLVATTAPPVLPTATPQALPTAAPPALPTAAPRALPTPAPPALPTAAPPASKPRLKVGLVTDIGGVNDKSFNQSAWYGAQKAGTDFGMDVRFIESRQPTDYERNIDQFATSGYDAIITVGFLMGDATAAKAKQYPKIKFAILDNAYFPYKGDKYCPDTVKDCYIDGDLKNITSLMFQEDEVGFLAGVIAGGMTKTGTVCTVSGMEIPPVVRYVVGYQNGAKWIKPDVKTLNVYIPSFTDPAKGKETGQSMISQGCDVVFGVGGNTGNGGLLAAKEKGLMAVGVDVDQYYTFPEVKDILITSAQKNVDVAVHNFLKSVSDGSVKAGINIANVQNNGVGLAPFHDWDSKIPQTVKDKFERARAGLKDGSITTGYRP